MQETLCFFQVKFANDAFPTGLTLGIDALMGRDDYIHDLPPIYTSQVKLRD